MKRTASLLFALALALMSGCALYVHVPMLRPAEVNISGIRKIGVLGLPVSPDVPPQFASELTARIAAAVAQNGYFSVTERADLAQLANQVAVPLDSIFDPTAMNRLGRALDVDALIFGAVDVLRIHDEVGVDEVEVSVPATTVVAPPPVVLPPMPHRPRPGPVVAPAPPVVVSTPPVVAGVAITQRRQYPFVVRIAELQIRLQLLRIADGRVVFLQPLSLRSAVKAYSGPRPEPAPTYYSVLTLDGSPRLFAQLPPPETFLSLFAQTIPERFVPHIVPTRYQKTIEFAKDGHPDNKRGLELARANAWDLAHQAFSDGISKEPLNAAMHYNLGIVAEAQGDFEAARRAYQQALALDPSRALFQAAHRSVLATLAEQEELRRQTGSPSQ